MVVQHHHFGRVFRAYRYAEFEGDAPPTARRVYNSVQFVGRDGASLANYRKTHLWQKYEKAHFVPGDALAPVVDFDGVRVGLLICYDVEFRAPSFPTGSVLSGTGLTCSCASVPLVSQRNHAVFWPSMALSWLFA